MNTHTDSIDLQKYKHIYFIGIGGSSMSSLAMILKRRGCSVCGYDRAHTRETQMLQNSGITVYDTTDESHFDGAELIVYTVAFAPDHPGDRPVRRGAACRSSRAPSCSKPSRRITRTRSALQVRMANRPPQG